MYYIIIHKIIAFKAIIIVIRNNTGTLYSEFISLCLTLLKQRDNYFMVILILEKLLVICTCCRPL